MQPNARDDIRSIEDYRDYLLLLVRLRRTNSLLAMLRYRLAIDRPGGAPRAFAMGAFERDQAMDSPLYVRGELDQPGQIVPRGLVRVLCAETPTPIATGSGRRELADWLASSANPLTCPGKPSRISLS